MRDRWQRIPVHRRPYYTPELRFRILRMKHLLALSCAETGRMFGIVGETVSRWENEITADPTKKTVGTLVRPNPPTRRYADVVREVVLAMTLMKSFGGDGMIARTLARAGWKLSQSTVAKYRKQPKPPAPSPGEATTKHAVRADYPLHVWMSDITQFPGLFGLTRFHVASIFDVYSRMPLATQTFDHAPSDDEINGLFHDAVLLHGKPRHFVSDQGSQYTSALLKATLERLGVKHRKGAVLKHGSIALIERLWLSLKVNLQRFPFSNPLLWEDLDEALYYSLVHYAFHRPHAGLGGATPSEVFYGRRQAHRVAKHPPRGKPGQNVGRAPFQIAHLDPQRRLPILVRAA